MKQLNFLQENDSSDLLPNQSHHYSLFVDGAARNNPGLAGAGIYILKDSELHFKQGFFLGTKTNNQAEYLALLLGLFFLQQFVRKDDTVRIVSDSELLVKQIKAEYRVKNKDLQPLHGLAQKMMRSCNAHIMHVLRTENHEADKMANHGIDKKVAIPHAFIELLAHHAITL